MAVGGAYLFAVLGAKWTLSLSVAHLYPEVERLYEHIARRILLEADVPHELNVWRVVRGVGDVDALVHERHRHEVGRADDERDKIDEHDRQPRTTDAAPDSAVTRVPNEQVPAAEHRHCTPRHRHAWWLSGRASDLRFTGRGFNFRPVRFLS